MPTPNSRTAYLHCRFPHELRHRLDAAAEERQLSRNVIVVRAVAAWLNEHEHEHEGDRLVAEILRARHT